MATAIQAPGMTTQQAEVVAQTRADRERRPWTVVVPIGGNHPARVMPGDAKRPAGHDYWLTCWPTATANLDGLL